MTATVAEPHAQPPLHQITAAAGFHPDDPTIYEPAAPQFNLPHFTKLKLWLRILAYVKIGMAVYMAGLKIFAICAVSSEQNRFLCGLLNANTFEDPKGARAAFVAFVCILHASMTWESQICFSMVGLVNRIKHENYENSISNLIALNSDLLEYPFLLLLFAIGKFNAFTFAGNGDVCPAFAYITVITATIVIGVSIVFLVVLLLFRRLVLQLDATPPTPDAEKVIEEESNNADDAET